MDSPGEMNIMDLDLRFWAILTLVVFIMPYVDADYCIDSDGINHYSKGYVTGDNIFEWVESQKGNVQVERAWDYCVGDVLYEQRCIESCSGTEGSMCNYQTTFTCPLGCDDGACPQKESLCQDSDGGVNPEIKGTTKDSRNPTKTDSCNLDRLIEYSCENDKLKVNDLWCKYGCQDGVCKPSTFICETGPFNEGDNIKIMGVQYQIWEMGDSGSFDKILTFKAEGSSPQVVLKPETLGGRLSIESCGKTYYLETDSEPKDTHVFSGTYNDVPILLSDSDLFIGLRIQGSEIGCTDTDGGKDWVEKGTVRGYDLNGNLTTQTDVCGSVGYEDKKLKEYYCTGDDHVYMELHNCVLGCEDGRCKVEPSQCMGGPAHVGDKIKISEQIHTYKESKELATNRQQVILKKDGGDQMIITLEPKAGTGEITFTTCGLNYKHIPDPDIYSTEVYSGKNWLGTYWLAEGALYVNPKVSIGGEKCFDTDGGNEIYKAGRAIHGDTIKNDYCSDVTLTEYYCLDDQKGIASYSKICPDGCRDGACIDTDMGCTDSDNGKDIYLRGTTTTPHTKKTDFCSGDNELTEYVCTGDQLRWDTVNCELGCEGGACKSHPQNCQETDAGIDISTKGTTRKGEYVKEDYCSNGLLTEFYCLGNEIQHTTTRCATDCSDGRCLDEKKICSETDKGEDFENYGVTSVQAGSSASYFRDMCKSERELVEYHCGDQGVEQTIFRCPTGCLGGECTAKKTQTESIRLYPGWNLINSPGIGIIDTGACKKVYGYLYIDGKYLSMQDAEKKLGKDLLGYISRNSFWVYSAEPCMINFEVSSFTDSSKFQFVKGWNFMPVTRDMMGNSVDDIRGECDITDTKASEQTYIWDGKLQKWLKRLNSVKMNEQDQYQGMLGYMGADCKFKKEGDVPLPPLLPGA